MAAKLHIIFTPFFYCSRVFTKQAAAAAGCIYHDHIKKIAESLKVFGVIVGNNDIYGGAGDDTLTAGGFYDTLYGEAGADYLVETMDELQTVLKDMQ